MKRAAALALTGFLAGAAFGANKNIGTSGAQFLKIGAGARPTAMGDAFVGVADDVNAGYYNPAGLGLLEKPEFTAMHTQYFQGLNYDYGAYVHPLAHGAVAFSMATLTTDDITRRGNDESVQGTFQNQDSAYTMSYAHKINNGLALGLTGRWISQEIDTASASTWSGDAGIFKRSDESPFTFGLAVRHFGQGVKFNEETDPLPLTIDGGAAVSMSFDRLILATNVRKARDADVQFGVGTEWRDSIFGKIRYAGRAGYNSANTDADGANGLSLGAGLGYKKFDFDFAWIPFGDLGNTFRYAAHVKF